MKAEQTVAPIGRTFICPGCLSVIANSEAVETWCVGGRKRDHLDDFQMIPLVPESDLIEAHTFLASIASAKPQRTVAQSKWMVGQAREGLRRSGGYDYDAEESLLRKVKDA